MGLEVAMGKTWGNLRQDHRHNPPSRTRQRVRDVITLLNSSRFCFALVGSGLRHDGES